MKAVGRKIVKLYQGSVYQTGIFPTFPAEMFTVSRYSGYIATNLIIETSLVCIPGSYLET